MYLEYNTFKISFLLSTHTSFNAILFICVNIFLYRHKAEAKILLEVIYFTFNRCCSQDPSRIHIIWITIFDSRDKSVRVSH